MRNLHTPSLLVLATALAGGGCDCGSSTTPTPSDAAVPDGTVAMDGGGPGAALDPGLLATYLDMAEDGSGNILFSGYSAGAPPRTQYGDLVVGTWAADEVTWTIVDGVPDEEPTRDPEGWRGGIRTAGDDVGRWSQIAVIDGNVHIAYQDTTNTALKYATAPLGSVSDASAWSTHTIDDTGNAGEHIDLVEFEGGPAVSFLQVVAPDSLPGRPVSRVRFATASGTPGSASDWSQETIVERTIDCRAAFCPEGSVCTESGVCAEETSDCAEDCGDQTCVAGSCVDTLADNYIDDHIPALGLYSSMATDGGDLGIVFYARSGDSEGACGDCGWGLACVDGQCTPPGGNLFGVSRSGGSWGAPFLIDGWASGDPASGDSGIGASLAIDGGTWHVSYADGAEENLRYATIPGGDITMISRTTVDDGSTDGTNPNPDGRHIVGDDSAITVSGDTIRIAYQDSTDQRAMLATKSGDGAWEIRVIDDADSTGYWVNQLLIGGTAYVGHWWRQHADGMEGNGVRVLTID